MPKNFALNFLENALLKISSNVADLKISISTQRTVKHFRKISADDKLCGLM